MWSQFAQGSFLPHSVAKDHETGPQGVSQSQRGRSPTSAPIQTPQMAGYATGTSYPAQKELGVPPQALSGHRQARVNPCASDIGGQGVLLLAAPGCPHSPSVAPSPAAHPGSGLATQQPPSARLAALGRSDPGPAHSPFQAPRPPRPSSGSGSTGQAGTRRRARRERPGRDPGAPRGGWKEGPGRTCRAGTRRSE